MKPAILRIYSDCDEVLSIKYIFPRFVMIIPCDVIAVVCEQVDRIPPVGAYPLV